MTIGGITICAGCAAALAFAGKVLWTYRRQIKHGLRFAAQMTYLATPDNVTEDEDERRTPEAGE
jgi:hypothetical protein